MNRKRRSVSEDSFEPKSKVQRKLQSSIKTNEELNKTIILKDETISNLRKENEAKQKQVLELKEEVRAKFEHKIINTSEENDKLATVEEFMTLKNIEAAQPNFITNTYRTLPGKGINVDVDVLPYGKFPTVIYILNQLRRHNDFPENKIGTLCGDFIDKPKKGKVLVTTRRANYSPNVVQLTNVILIVEIDKDRKVMCIEKLIAKVARYDRCLANDIADTFLTKESKMASYIIFYNVKNHEQFVMLKMIQFPAVQVPMNEYITLMSYDLSLLISGVDVTPCFECQELFISNTHDHDIMNNIIQSLANTKVTENMILKKEYSTNLNENLVILFGMLSVEEIVETLTPRMSGTKIQREKQVNKLPFKRFGGKTKKIKFSTTMKPATNTELR